MVGVEQWPNGAPDGDRRSERGREDELALLSVRNHHSLHSKREKDIEKWRRERESERERERESNQCLYHLKTDLLLKW